MIEDKDIVEINGKKYNLDTGYRSGPAYEEVELATFHSGEKYWVKIDDSLVLCGKCKGDTFKVSSCSSNYESWAHCPCGNKILLHSG